MDKKELSSKAWYRFAKVIYIFGYILALGIVALTANSEKPYSFYSYSQLISGGNWNNVWETGFWGLIIVVAIFEIIRRIFLYIVVSNNN